MCTCVYIISQAHLSRASDGLGLAHLLKEFKILAQASSFTKRTEFKRAHIELSLKHIGSFATGNPTDD